MPQRIIEPTITFYGMVEVDYTRPLAALIVAGGYNYVGPVTNSPACWPHQRSGKITREAVTVGFGRCMTTAQAEADLKRLGIESWWMADLCTFGAKCPDMQRERLVVAVGQHWLDPDRGRHFGALFRHGSERYLDLLRRDESSEWSERCVFGGFRK